MKTIELKKGETARIVGGKIIIEEAFQPKDGDFVTLDDQWVSIYKSSKSNNYIYDYGGTGMPGSRYNRSWSVGGPRYVSTSIRPSTKAEIQIALDALDKKDLRWNAEEKRAEEKRWRAEPGGSYERVTMIYGTAVLAETIDKYTLLNDSEFESGNYYKPGTGEAQNAADKINKIFKSNM